MYHNSFLESKRYAKIHIDNNMDVRNIHLAPFIVEGGSVFKKQSYFLGSIIVGDNFVEKEGQIVYRNGEFMGYNGNQWKSFTRENIWTDGDGVITTEGKKIGINKINPKKTLEIGGDALVDKKMHVGDVLSCNGGLLLGENQTKKKSGMIRFWENKFEGFDGEKWINLGGNSDQMRDQMGDQTDPSNQTDNLEKIQKIGLLNCPLTFIGNIEKMKTNLWYDWENECYNLGRIHEGNMELIRRDDLYIRGLKLDGDIIMNGKSTIKNVMDPQNSDDVATKRYVDTISQGLQNYLFVDYLLLEEDIIAEDFPESSTIDIKLSRNSGDMIEGNIIGVIINKMANMYEIIGMTTNQIKLKNLQEIQTPAKICVNLGRYGNSEYFIFDKEDNIGYLQVNGIENLEYNGCIKRIGKQIELNVSPIFTNDKVLAIKDCGITGNYLGEKIIEDKHISDGCIKMVHIGDGIIENRHFGKSIINGTNIEEKSISGRHMKDGFIKNNHFGTGIITERELASECINMTHLKSAIILTKHISKKSISGENIMDNTIERKNLMDKIIDSVNLNDGIILANHIYNGQIEEHHLKQNIINENHIINREIKGRHIDDGVIEYRHFGIGLIDGLNLGGGNIKEQSINEKHIVRNSIMDWHIYSDQIKRHHLEENIIDSNKIIDGAIIERHIGNNIIGQQHIKRGSINTTHLALNIIDEKHIINNSIKTNKIMDGAIIDSKLAESSITTGKIKDRTITNDKLKLPFIKIETDQMFVCPQVVNLGDSLHIGLNNNYMIPRKRDGVVEFMGAVRFGDEGSGQKMEVNMELDVKGKFRIGGEEIFCLGEIRGFARGVKIDDKKWAICDGKRVKRSQYYELYKEMQEKKEDGDDFYLPDIKHESIDYYIRHS